MDRSSSTRLIGVTGAGGYIGAALVDYLLQRGYRVRALDCFTRGHIPIPSWEKEVEIVDQDLTRFGPSLRAFTDGLDFVFDLAAIPEVARCEADPAACLQNNAVARVALLREVTASNVAGYLLASSITSVYGEVSVPIIDEYTRPHPQNIYGLSKVWAEEAARLFYERHPFATLIVRQANVYGPSPALHNQGVLHRFLQRALAHEPLQIYGDGRQVRSFLFIEDLLAAYVGLMERALQGPPQWAVINLPGATAPIGELAQWCLRAVGQPGVSPSRIEYLPARVEATDEGLQISTQKVTEWLGHWSPTPLQQGICTTLRFLRSYVSRPTD
ncbi:MAG: SDR family oxidoreductase [Firmicutes bacterium]|nr:SDR family oxidoreductase [Bacillota bacterium]